MAGEFSVRQADQSTIKFIAACARCYCAKGIFFVENRIFTACTLASPGKEPAQAQGLWAVSGLESSKRLPINLLIGVERLLGIELGNLPVAQLPPAAAGVGRELEYF